MTQSAPGFYGTYAGHKAYATPEIGRKQIIRLDQQIWGPAQCRPDHSFLELGCGTGAVMAYLRGKGVARLVGIDHDPALAEVIPAAARGDFLCRDIWEAVGDPALGVFDRIILMDVLEHFSAEEALRLLQSLRGRLAEDGRVVIRVPNGGSPWGLPYQNGDLTHRTAFAPIAVRQLAHAAGFAAPLIYPHREGARVRLLVDAALCRFLSWALLNPPEIWSANLYAVLRVKS